MFFQKDLIKILESHKSIKSDDLKKYQEEAKNENRPLEEILEEKNVVNNESLYEMAAKYYKLPFVNLKNNTIRKDILNIIPEPIASAHQIISFDLDVEKNTLKVAALDPNDLQTIEFIKKKTGMNVMAYLTTPKGLNEILKQYKQSLRAEFEKISAEQKETINTTIKERKNLEDLAQDLPIIRIVDTLLEYAIFEGASDIHIEPTDKEVLVRYRIDGILKDVMNLPKKVAPGIVARIKILSNLKLDEHRLPQDGRFKISTDTYKISFRVSIIPVFDGEKIVMRLLNESTQILTLEQLGFRDKNLETIKKNIDKPHGMILVTGPTGSGKTTTLYTILHSLNKPGINITTIEDPIEYRMPRVNQSQVNPKIGYTFAGGLRAFLRQDPNIIMVGEIRDNETAEIAVNAAMTGHLVLSTLHTNDAATALPRLQDMNVPSFLIATTTNIIIAQRLVRKICPNCIMSYNLDKQAVAELQANFDIKEILEVLAKEGSIASAKEPIGSLLFYKGKGCKQCGNSGYKGRLGIYEILEVTEDVAKMVMNKASSEQILSSLQDKNQMLTMAQDGFVKAKDGLTTLEEILRVTKE